MNINKAITSLLSIAVLATVSVGMASAAPGDQKTFASATGAGAFDSNCFTYTGSSGFSITPGATFTAQYLKTPPGQFPTTLSFVGLQNVGTATAVSNGYQQALSGGSFSLTADGGSTLLLSGTFDGGNLLTGTTGSTTSSITNTLTNVIYTGGSYFTASGLSNPGAFSLSMTSVTPTIGITNGHFNDFVAGGTGTFSATTPSSVVPEPATVVPFVLGGLGLLGLVARKARRTSGATV